MFETENFILNKKIIKKNSTCPVTSRLITIKVNVNETFVFHERKQEINLKKECHYCKKTNQSPFMLIDTAGLLDYINTDETQTICNYTLHEMIKYRFSKRKTTLIMALEKAIIFAQLLICVQLI